MSLPILLPTTGSLLASTRSPAFRALALGKGIGGQVCSIARTQLADSVIVDIRHPDVRAIEGSIAGNFPTGNTPETAPSLVRIFDTEFVPILTTHMLEPSKTIPSGFPPTEYVAAVFAPHHRNGAKRFAFGTVADEQLAATLLRAPCENP